MKNKIKYILQSLLGYQRYLYWFSIFKIKTLKSDKKEGDFFHFLNTIKAEGDILDIGANIGIMTYHLAKKFPTKTIYAIEPMPDNLHVLNKIVISKKLNNVVVLPVAVGQKNEVLDMVLPLNGKVKMQGLAHVVHESIEDWNEGDKIKVDCLTLDKQFVDKSISGIKMDIENFEYFALLGGKKMIENHKPIIYLELWPNENRKQCFDFLNALNYNAHVVINNQLIKYNPTKHTKQNFVFIP